MRINETISWSLKFDQLEVDLFSLLSGDHNPLHTKEFHIQNVDSKGVLVHGMLVAAKFGGFFGTKFPGYGSLNLERSFKFIRPVYVGETYQANVKLKEVNIVDNTAYFHLSVKDNHNRICISGATLIKNNVIFNDAYYNK